MPIIYIEPSRRPFSSSKNYNLLLVTERIGKLVCISLYDFVKCGIIHVLYFEEGGNGIPDVGWG